MAEENCERLRPVAHYMCNGLCIPALIPCNNTCLSKVEWPSTHYTSTYSSEKLFGPATCTMPMYWGPTLCTNWYCGAEGLVASSDRLWTGALEPLVLASVIEMIGHDDGELGVCLPGYHGCNGTCPLDPGRPFASKCPTSPKCPLGWGNGEIVCSDGGGGNM